MRTTYCSVECQTEAWSAGHVSECSIQTPLTELLKRYGRPDIMRRLRAMKDDEVWEQLKQHKQWPNIDFTWRNINTELSDKLESYDVWMYRCSDMNPAWTDIQLDRELEQRKSGKWFRRWCILYEANLGMVKHVRRQMVPRFRVENARLSAFRSAFEFLGKRVDNYGLAVRIFNGIAVNPNDTTYEFSIRNDENGWLSPMLHTFPSGNGFFIGGKQKATVANTEHFDVFDVSPDNRMFYLMLGIMQAATRGSKYQSVDAKAMAYDFSLYKVILHTRVAYFGPFMEE